MRHTIVLLLLTSASARSFFDLLKNNETAYTETVQTVYLALDQNQQGFFTDAELQNVTAIGIKRLKLPRIFNINNVTVEAIDLDGNCKHYVCYNDIFM